MNPHRLVPAVLLAVLWGTAAAAAEPGRETEPSASGPVRLVTASWLGGAGDDEIVAAEIAPDGTIVLAGNTVDLAVPGVTAVVLGPEGTLQKDARPPSDGKKNAPRWTHPSTHGFVLRLSPDGRKALGTARFGYGISTIRRLKLDERGALYVLADGPEGAFLAVLPADAGRVTRKVGVPGALDFGVDAGGEFVVLTKARMTRYGATGSTPKWSVTWEAHGDNRPGGMAVSPRTGVAAVVGYGMTHTGREPYKDPYAYGFDREGRRVWALWNPDPKKEQDAKFGGNGLMADTTGVSAGVGANGRLFLTLYADGGNTVCMRDPLDPGKPLDKAVMDGVFQRSAGHGFKGASKTAVTFRVDSATGRLEKGTWLCAWLSPARANSLAVDAAAGDGEGRQFVVGRSAFGCPTKSPWYVCKEGGYQGGGFVAAFDGDFRMLQAGYFPATDLGCVSVRDGYAVVAGSAKEWEDREARVPARVYRPLQGAFGGGERDGYFAVFKLGAK